MNLPAKGLAPGKDTQLGSSTFAKEPIRRIPCSPIMLAIDLLPWGSEDEHGSTQPLPKSSRWSPTYSIPYPRLNLRATINSSSTAPSASEVSRWNYGCPREIGRAHVC